MDMGAYRSANPTKVISIDNLVLAWEDSLLKYSRPFTTRYTLAIEELKVAGMGVRKKNDPKRQRECHWV